MICSLAVEGPTDEAVLRRIVEFLGHSVGPVFGRNGKASLLRGLRGYNHAAQFTPWIVVVDLDRELCVVTSVKGWLEIQAPKMCFRVAVREIESWLLADRERMASYFGISVKHVPEDPDCLTHPKTAFINAVRHSRRKSLREDVVPEQGLGQTVGPAYAARLIEFATSSSGWRPEVASLTSPSLARAMDAIRDLNLRVNDVASPSA